MPEATLLAIGDVHLGRRPSRLPDSVEPRAVGPAAALRAAVDEALSRRVDAVLFAGDVVEASSAYLEAYGPLRDAVARLTGAGIAVLGVAGNHDTEVLPRLADDHPAFRLLGRGGEWESAVVSRDGAPLVRVVGWSFPSAQVREDPVTAFPAAWRGGRFDDGAPDALPTIGLLHGELDQPRSPHAPLSRATLDAAPVAAWLLGHVHAPSLDPASDRPTGYLGTLAALDPGEPGRRGPWLARAGDGRVALEHLPLSPVRYEALAVDCEGADDEAALEARVARATTALEERLAGELDAVRALALRITLEGASAASPTARAAVLERLRTEPSERGGRAVVYETARDATRPARDLAALSLEPTPAGLLAQRLLDLEAGGAGALVAATRDRLRETSRHPSLVPVHADRDLADDAVRARLVRQGRRALEALLRQREEAPA